MSSPNDKTGWPTDYAADLHRMDCQNAGALLDDDANLAEIPAEALRSLRDRINLHLTEYYGEDSLEERAAR